MGPKIFKEWITKFFKQPKDNLNNTHFKFPSSFTNHLNKSIQFISNHYKINTNLEIDAKVMSNKNKLNLSLYQFTQNKHTYWNSSGYHDQKRYHHNHSKNCDNESSKESQKSEKSEFENKVKSWLKKSGYTLFVGLTGYTIASIIPSSWTREREKEFRKMLGTDMLEIESQHIEPPPRDYSEYIHREETIRKIENQFDSLEQEREYNPNNPNHFLYKFYQSKAGSIVYKLFSQSKIVDILLITGVQGSGKSELAEEYANKYAAKLAKAIPSIPRTVKIFKAEYTEDLKQQYTDFARELGVEVQNCIDIQDIIAKVNEKLLLRERWLLVFDNVTEENYSKVNEFIPKGNKFKGRVILTAQNRKIIPNDQFLSIKVIDLSHADYRFTPKESVCLIDNILRNSPFNAILSAEKKIQLASSLGYLPQAIKRVALYVRHLDQPTEKAYLEYFDGLQNQLKTRLNLSDNNVEASKHYKEINETVNNLSIKAIAKNEMAIKILSFSAFLNPDYIQRELLELKFVKNSTFLTALDLIKNYGLLEDKGQGHFKLHRSIIPSIISTVPEFQLQVEKSKPQNQDNGKIDISALQDAFVKKELNETIEFIRTNFKRDNTVFKVKQRNNLFAFHINTFVNHCDQHQALINNRALLNAELMYFKIALSTYYMMSGRSVLGQEILASTKNKIEGNYQLQSVLDRLYDNKIKLGSSIRLMSMYEKNTSLSAKKIVEREKSKVISLQDNIKVDQEMLRKVQTEILTIYAQNLYHMGCAHYDIGDMTKETIAKKHLEQAVIVRNIIDGKISNNSQEKQYDNAFNEFEADSKIVIRNGILKFRYKNTDFFKELEKIAEDYTSIIKKEKNTPSPDKKHIHSCYSELFRIYQKLGSMETDSHLKQEYYKNAKEIIRNLYCEDKEVKDAFDNSSGKINFEILVNKIPTISRLRDDTRLARYLNDIGKFLLNYENEPILTEQCFREAALLIEQKENVNIDLPDAYLGLAFFYERENNLDLAERAVKRCLLVQDRVGMAKTHDDAILAQKVLYRVKEKQLDEKMKKEGALKINSPF